MKLAINERYGTVEVIKLIDAPVPKISSNQVLVKVVAAALNPKDILVRKGKFKRFTGKKFPQSIGFDFSGTIEDPGTSSYEKGEQVFGMLNGWQGRCCAEFVNIDAKELYKMPDNLSFEAAAGVPLVGQTALQAIRDIGQLKSGQKICINGGSGGVGTIAIQIARALGGIVTSVSSSKNLEFCRSLGAHYSLAYSETPILDSKDRFDVFFDVFGNYSFKETAHLLTDQGKYITTVPKPDIFKELIWNFWRKKKAKLVVVKSKRADLNWLHDQLEEEKIKPVVDKVYPLSDIKAAQEYIESKRAKGKIILQLGQVGGEGLIS